MNKWYILVILLQSSLLWSAASGRDENRLHAAIKGIDCALSELHTDMQDIKGNITTTAQHSSQLPTLVEKVDALLGIGQSLLGELRQQNAHLEISAKAQTLSALIAHAKVKTTAIFLSKDHPITLLADDLSKHVQQK
jgi:hypothetical protein